MNSNTEITPQKLGELCHMFGINIDQDDLLKSSKALTEQIASGECELVINKEGLFRKVEACLFKIYHRKYLEDIRATRVWILHQVYETKGGKVSREPGGKKIKCEASAYAAQRELKEELGLDFQDYVMSAMDVSVRTSTQSGSTPGIPKIQTEYWFQINIDFDNNLVQAKIPTPPESLSFEKTDEKGKILKFEWVLVFDQLIGLR